MNHRLPWLIELHIDADVLARLIQDGKLVVDENGFIAGEGRKGGSSYANVQNALRAAHGNGFAYCQCVDTPREQRALQVRRVRNEFLLARNSGTGPGHNPLCFFFVPDPSQSGAQSYVKGVIRETSDGMFQVRLKTPLSPKRKRMQSNAESLRPGDEKPGQMQRAMTQLGLLHLLWQIANANYWNPAIVWNEESTYRALHRIRHAASVVKAGRIAVDKVLAVRVTKEWAKKRRRGLVLGILEDIDKQRSHIILRDNEHTNVRFTADIVSLTRLEASFKSVIGVLNHVDRGTDIVALLTCDFEDNPDNGNRVLACVEDAALMMVDSKSLIPVESRYELEFARHLISSRRLFTKPMRYDANEDVIFPDFILHDATSTHDFPIEVWGRNDQAYLDRRERKVAYLRETFGDNWTAWDAIAGKPFPELPQQRKVSAFHAMGQAT